MIYFFHIKFYPEVQSIKLINKLVLLEAGLASGVRSFNITPGLGGPLQPHSAA